MLENVLILKQCIIQFHNLKKVIKLLRHRSPVLGTNGGRSKSTTVFMHFCIEYNGKSLKFDTFAKIKVTSMLEISVSLRYAMYIHMICEKKKKEIKTGGDRSCKKMGPVPHCFCQDREH